MLQQLPEDEYGPGIGFREYSFMDNPSVHKQVMDTSFMWMRESPFDYCHVMELSMMFVSGERVSA